MALTDLDVSVKHDARVTATRDASGKSSSRLADDVQSFSILTNASFEFGTGANAANQVYQDERTLAAGTSEDLNISGGAHGGAVALTNPMAEAISLTAVKLLVIKNTSANTGTTIRAGGEATNGFTALFGDNSDMISIPSGGEARFLLPTAAGYPVATDEVLQITNADGSNAATYQILIIGLE